MATWNLGLQFQSGVQLEGVAAGKSKGSSVWVTDFALMSNCNKLALAMSSRELMFCEISTQNYKCLYRVYGKINNVAISYIFIYLYNNTLAHGTVTNDDNVGLHEYSC